MKGMGRIALIVFNNNVEITRFLSWRFSWDWWLKTIWFNSHILAFPNILLGHREKFFTTLQMFFRMSSQVHVVPFFCRIWSSSHRKRRRIHVAESTGVKSMSYRRTTTEDRFIVFKIKAPYGLPIVFKTKTGWAQNLATTYCTVTEKSNTLCNKVEVYVLSLVPNENDIGQRQWTSCQFITGVTWREKQPFISQLTFTIYIYIW